MAGFVKIDEDDLQFGDVISFELATILKNNIDLLSIAVPVGEVVPIMTGIPGVPTPDSNIWQECNGSEITNENSPLRTIGATQRFTPDLRNRYIKVPQIFGESGVDAGFNDNFIFRHDHAGVTGGFTAPEDGDSSSNQFRTASNHAHTIDYSFDFAFNVEPPFFTVRWFMRIQ